MPVLIDNYSSAGRMPAMPTEVTTVQYKTDVHGPSPSSIVYPFPSKSGINQRILNLLKEYAQLKDNWDDDDALAPDETALMSAKFLTLVLAGHGQVIFHAAPGPNGEIMLDIRNRSGNRSLEIIFYAQRAVAVMFPEGGKPAQDTFEIEKLPQMLQWLHQK